MTLRPCPFCGSETLRVSGRRNYYVIECENCLARGPFALTDWEAEQRWNARAGEA